MLNEDDKKYLKGNIEKKIDDLDKKISSKKSSEKSASNPNSEIGKKLNELYKKDAEKDDTRKYIEELQKKSNNGEATLAQKIEILSLNLKSALPDDFKDAVKETSANIKKGANQAMSGASYLTGRLMGLTPLTAMLWQNRDIAKAMWDMGIGGAKAIGSAIGGIGRGAAGLVNASVNMFKKKNKPQTEEEVPEQEETPKAVIDSEDDTEEFSEEEKSTAQKINELHDLFFKGKFFQKQEKEEKQRQNILSKGLSGLGKTMKAVNSVIEVIAAKQKTILGGVMLGAVGLLALIGWIKNRFGNQFYSPNNPDGLSINAHDNEDKSKKLKEQSEKTYTSDVANDDLLNQIDKGGKIKQTGFYDFSKEKNPIRAMNDLAKSGVIDNSQREVLNGATGGKGGKRGYIGSSSDFNSQLTTYESESELSPIQFPVYTKVLYKHDTANDSTIIVENPKNKEKITISNIKRLIANLNVVYEPNYVIALAGKKYAISGNKDKFLNGVSFEEQTNEQASKNWENAKESTSRQRDKNDIIKKQKQEKKDNDERSQDIKFWQNVQKVGKKIKDSFIDKGEVTGQAALIDNVVDTDELDIKTTPLPKNDLNNSNKTDKQIEQKKQEIKNTDKQIDEDRKLTMLPQQVPQNEPLKVSLNPVDKRIPEQPSETMTIDQYNRATEWR